MRYPSILLGAFIKAIINLSALTPNAGLQAHVRPTGKAVAIDIGGVIVQHGNDSGPGFLDEETFLDAQEVAGAYAAIQQLVRFYGVENVFILSRAREHVSRRSVEYFMHTKFIERTGIDPRRILFVRERADKRLVLDRLNIGLLIDDTWTVLARWFPP